MPKKNCKTSKKHKHKNFKEIKQSHKQICKLIILELVTTKAQMRPTPLATKWQQTNSKGVTHTYSNKEKWKWAGGNIK